MRREQLTRHKYITYYKLYTSRSNKTYKYRKKNYNNNGNKNSCYNSNLESNDKMELPNKYKWQATQPKTTQQRKIAKKGVKPGKPASLL